ncbi:GumC family protein [Ancylobacter terrae]|uniref:GumC family protein n=1 Tax=Ancylobacter sp. sgz301288 TaxID=3342077 RepID=UPI00385DF9BC
MTLHDPAIPNEAAPGAPGLSPPGTAERGVDVMAVARHLWARRFRILLPTLLVAVIAAVVVSMLSPLFSSEARLLIENRETVYNRPQASGSADGGDRSVVEPEAIASQVQVILSRDLARQVVRDLKLTERPEFLKGPNPVLRFLGLASEPSAATKEERVLEVYYKNLNVFPLEKSRVISIDFTSSDPRLAATIANTIAEDYLKLQQMAKADATRQATQWLSTEIDNLRTRVADAEAKVEAFRSQADLYVGSSGVTLSAQQLAELNSQLTLAQSQKADAESKANAVRVQLRSGRTIEASELLSSPLLRNLIERRALLRASLAEQSASLLSKHPRIKELRAQVADLDGQIRAEAEAVLRGFDNDARAASERVDALTRQLNEVKRQASVAGGQDVQLRALEREARSQRELLESYLARYRDATSREDPTAVQPDGRIISRASPAIEPSFPKRVPIIVLAAFATFFLLTAFFAVSAILSNLTSGGSGAPSPTPLPEPSERGRTQHLPWIGGSASQDTSGDAKLSGALTALEERSTIDGTLADLTRMVELRGEAARLVIVTGPAPDEGVARCALALARSLAGPDKRVAMVCLDVHATTLGELMPDARAPGLADLLFGVATFSEAIHREPSSRCHVIPPGRGAGEVGGLVASERLTLILSALQQTYDHVVVAAPPLGEAEGADRLARLSPTVVLVTQPGGVATNAVEAFDALAARGFGDIAMVTFVVPSPEPVAEAEAA